VGSVGKEIYIILTEEERQYPIRKFDGRLIKIYRRPKRATQLIRLMLLHCAQIIITRSCPYSYRFSSLTQSTEPAQNEALLQ
ncbi:conserved hypothetical protein, partial [Trichinella spiralis]|uniref:hypothetical protein n=1 Tax=Trichinella spiralis TaxID=6334 RepID=UPI0001EFEE3D